MGRNDHNPNLVRLEPRVACVPLARRNLAAQIRYLIAAHGITVAYSLLNASDGSTEATLELLDHGVHVPIVRHYKEHPCTPTLEERRVLLESAGQIYVNIESFDFFRATYGVSSASAHIMDADMIAERYMTDDFAPKARCEDGAPHLLVAGGMSMLQDRLDVRSLCIEMNKLRVHVHLYGYVMTEIDGRHVVMLSLWESLQAIVAFNGSDAARARYYPEDARYLLELEPTVTHFDVDIQAIRPPSHAPRP